MSSGSVQKVAILFVALSAATAFARVDDPNGLYGPWRVDATESNASAGATVRVPSGWSASLYLSSLGNKTLEQDAAQLKSSTFVNARLSRNLTKNTRVSLDVFNIFNRSAGEVDYFSTTRTWNQPGAGDNFLFNPAEPRGFRIKLRTTF